VKKTENLRIKVASSYLNITMPVSNLGLILDKPLWMQKQVDSIWRHCYYHKRNIGLIRKWWGMQDFSPSLYYFSTGLWKCIVIKYPLSLTNWEHLTPVLFRLQWLPERFRSQCNILLDAFKELSGTAPLYLSDLSPQQNYSFLEYQKAIQHQLQGYEITC